MFCSRVVSSCGKTAEWPFGSSFGNSRQVPLGFTCAIPWDRSSSSQKALWCRGALRVGGVRWAVEVFLGLSLKLLFCNPFLTSPKPDLLQLSLPQPGHQHLLHCALRLGSFGTSWITCTSLIPWATSCSPKTAQWNRRTKMIKV